VLDSACVVKIDPNAPLKKMTLLSCGISTGKIPRLLIL
jgi:alcohol dehydrogenase